MLASVARLAAGRSAESPARPIPGHQCATRWKGRDLLLTRQSVWVWSENAAPSAKRLAQAVSSGIAWLVVADILSLFGLSHRNLSARHTSGKTHSVSQRTSCGLRLFKAARGIFVPLDLFYLEICILFAPFWGI